MIENMSVILSTIGLILVYLTALWSSSAPKIRKVYKEIDEWLDTKPLDNDRREKLQNKWNDTEIPIPLMTCIMNFVFSIILIYIVLQIINTSSKFSICSILLYVLFCAQLVFMLSTTIPFIKFLMLKREKKLFPTNDLD